MRQKGVQKGKHATFTVLLLFLTVVILGAGESQTQVNTVMAPGAEVRIISFGEYVQPGTMLATTGGGAPAIPTYRRTCGDNFVFSWTFLTKNARAVSAKIIGGGQEITLNPGTPTNANDGWKRYSNRRSYTIRTAGVYTLRVTALMRGPNSIKEKQIRFEVRCATLEARPPRVSPDTMKVTFRVKNTGNASATGRFRVSYQIQGRSPTRQLLQNSFTTDSMEIRRGHTLSLGEVTLPDSAWNHPQIWMRVNISLIGNPSLTAPRKDFTYNWPVKTLTINDTLLDLVEAIMTGHVLIDNYKEVSGNRTKHRPYEQNASEIVLMGQPYNFTFPYILYEIAKVEHFFFVRNFRAGMGGRDFLTIAGGRLAMNIAFNCSADREVKGWVRNWVRKDYSDSGSPDIDIQEFKLTVSLEPILRGSKISYRNPRVSVSSRMRVAGGWSFLNVAKDKINNGVKDSVKNGFEDMLNQSSIKTLLEDKLTEVVNTMGGAIGIHKLISVRGDGNRIIVTYR